MATAPRPFVPCPGVVELRAHYVVNGLHPASVAVHVANGASVAGADLQPLAHAWYTTVAATALTHQDGTCNLTECTAVTLEEKGGQLEVYAPSGGTSGSQAAAKVGPQVALLTKVKTAKRGRNFRGRIFWPQMSSIMTSSAGPWGSDLLSAVPGWLATWNAAIVGIGTGYTYVVVVLSRFTGKAPRPSGITTTATSLEPVQDFRTQRRREWNK